MTPRRKLWIELAIGLVAILGVTSNYLYPAIQSFAWTPQGLFALVFGCVGFILVIEYTRHAWNRL